MKLVRRWISPILIALVLIPIGCFGNGEEKRALVIIDMQPFFISNNGFDSTPENKAKLDQLIAAQIEAIRAAKQTKIPIIFVEYEGKKQIGGFDVTPDGKFINPQYKDYGPTDTRLKDAATGADTIYFKKGVDGLLDLPEEIPAKWKDKMPAYYLEILKNQPGYRQQVLDYLQNRKINTLIVIGANGGSCVKQSIMGILTNNVNVIAYDKGIADFNYKDFIYPYGVFQNNEASLLQYPTPFDLDHPPCQSCSFKETSDLNSIFPDAKKGDLNDLVKVNQQLNNTNSAKGCEP